jgi:murein DD-endopeptidase MepM/ murein hydrolase activator NlpD
VANHRAPRRSASRTGTTDGMTLAEAATPAPVAGKRKAVKPSKAARTLSRRAQTPQPAPAPARREAAPASARREPSPAPARREAAPAPARREAAPRKSPFMLLPSAPSAVGAAALIIAAAGALTVSDNSEIAASAPTKMFTPASAFTGTSAATSSLELDSRLQAVSRDSQRAALEDASDEDLLEAVEAQAEERNAALAQLAASAEKYAGQIAANAWHLPLANYRLTARFGYSSSLWANTHTGLDFAAPSGTPVLSVANGTVRSAEYDGSYGNKIVVVLEDGTEIWYAHLSSFTVSPGQQVRGGQQIGTVGSTGNSTGSHLHLEVRPGAGDAVDPYAALLAHGLTP